MRLKPRSGFCCLPSFLLFYALLHSYIAFSCFLVQVLDGLLAQYGTVESCEQGYYFPKTSLNLFLNPVFTFTAVFGGWLDGVLSPVAVCAVRMCFLIEIKSAV